MLESDSFFRNTDPRYEDVVKDIGTIIAMGLKRLGQDGNFPDTGELARPEHPLNPSHFGEVALQEPTTA